MFFDSWADIGRVIAASATMFVLIVVLLRVVGQKALAKMSGYDVVVTVTLGSIVASVAVTKGITVTEGLAALATLLALQETMRWFQARYLAAHHLVREPPRVMLWEGKLLEERLRASSVSADEVRAAVRRQGLRSLEDAQIVVLENDGQWSVIPRSARVGDDSALFGLPIPGRPGSSPDDDDDGATPSPPQRIP
jgi:uncharacterized membrane protein YcaP (DUF421 family)